MRARLLLLSTLLLGVCLSHADIRDNNRVERTGGDDMEGPFTVHDGSITASLGLLVNGTTSTFTGGQIFLSSSTTATSYMKVGKSSTGESTITNSSVSGLVRIMPGKANPQIILGDATTTGLAFIDASSARPLLLNQLSTGPVQIQSLEMTSNSTMTLDGSMRIIGTGQPSTGIALCITTGGFFGHCTGIPALTWACTCVSP